MKSDLIVLNVFYDNSGYVINFDKELNIWLMSDSFELGALGGKIDGNWIRMSARVSDLLPIWKWLDSKFNLIFTEDSKKQYEVLKNKKIELYKINLEDESFEKMS